MCGLSGEHLLRVSRAAHEHSLVSLCGATEVDFMHLLSDLIHQPEMFMVVPV